METLGSNSYGGSARYYRLNGGACRRYKSDISGDAVGSGSTLPFANYDRDSEAFGQLVKNYHQVLNEVDDEHHVKVIPSEELYPVTENNNNNNNDNNNGEHGSGDYFRDADGKFMNGADTAREARLQGETVEGMTSRLQVKIPERLTKTIYNNILALHEPKVLKFAVAERYVSLNKEMLYRPTKGKAYDVDTYIAAFFAQDYASSHSVLTELVKRLPEGFSPKRVLDVGYGPATGMLALNELMGDDFKPDVKHAVVVGHQEMKERAKLLLSRQVCEFPGDINDLAVEDQEAGAAAAVDDDRVKSDQDVIYDDFIGEVKTKKLKIRTQLSSDVGRGKKYDLIIAQHQLLSDIDAFPYQVDDKVDGLLKMLEPEGILVLIERGSPLGFENIARARQIMIRPENFESEKGKIPRPYIKGSSVKRDAVEFEEVEEELEEFYVDEDGNEVSVTALEKDLNSQFGEVSEEELEFKDLGVETEDNLPERMDYHLSIIAPCSHHKKCPLQTLKPHYYKFPTGKKMNWCKYEKMLERPRYLMELKRGKVLSSKWEERDEVSPVKRMSASSGREATNNYEITNYSYLIAQRSANDAKTLDKVAEAREANDFDDSIGKFHTEKHYWPRIMRQPMKRKGHVMMEVCAPSGKIEKWTVTRSFDKATYYDARKSHSGDLWGLDAKTKIMGRSNQDENLAGKLENYEKELVSKVRKSRHLKDKMDKKEMLLKSNDILKNEEVGTDDVIELYTNRFNSTKKQRQKDKRGGLKLE
jgi:ribosomal protein RSM22 (predicted rRNA methylase)